MVFESVGPVLVFNQKKNKNIYSTDNWLIDNWFPVFFIILVYLKNELLIHS